MVEHSSVIFDRDNWWVDGPLKGVDGPLIPQLKNISVHIWNGREERGGGWTVGSFNFPGDYSMGRLRVRMAQKLETYPDNLEVLVPWSNIDKSMMRGSAALALERREQFKVAGPEDPAHKIGMRTGDHIWVRILLKASPKKKPRI